MPAAPTGATQSSAMPSSFSASHVAGTAAAPASNESNSPAGGPSPAATAEAQGFSSRAAGSAEPSAKAAGAAARLPSTAVARSQRSLTPSALDASSTGPPVSTMGDVPQAQESIPQAKGDALQSKGEGAQRMASAQGPTATGGDAKYGRRQEQQPVSTTQDTPAHLPSSDLAVAAPPGTDQRQEQTKAKASIKPVRVVRYLLLPPQQGPIGSCQGIELMSKSVRRVAA